MTKKLTLTGEVFSGTKKGKHYVNLQWVKNQINAKLGFNTHMGTLNLRLTNETVTKQLRKAIGINIVPENGYCNGKCFKALVNRKVEGAIVLPDVPDYPTNVLEVLAPINLRKTFNLKDGDTVEVIVTVE